jgi:hypothetical protein
MNLYSASVVLQASVRNTSIIVSVRDTIPLFSHNVYSSENDKDYQPR